MKFLGAISFVLMFCLTGCGGGETTILQTTPVSPSQMKIISVEPAENEQLAPASSFVKINVDGFVTEPALDSASCSIFESNQPLAGTLTFFESTIFFVPDTPLTYGQLYTVSFHSKDSSFESRSWTFKVEDDPDPFTVDAADLTSNPAEVSINPLLGLTFSMSLDVSTFSPGDISLRGSLNQQVPVDGWYNSATQTLSISPTYPLEHAETYSIQFSGDLTSTTGKSFTSPEPLFFTTEADIYAPEVLWTAPHGGDTAVPYDGNIVIRFSELLDPTTVIASNFSMNYTGWSESVPFSLSYNLQDLEVVLVPDNPMVFTASVQVDIAQNLLDRAGNAIAAPYSFSFTTSTDYIAPSVVAAAPADNSIDIATDTAITLEFSEPIDPDSVKDDSYFFQVNAGYYRLPVPNTVAVNGKFLTITPTEGLQNDADYKIDLDADYYNRILDLSGNQLSGSQEFSFTTEPLGSSIDVGMAIDAFTYDETNNFLYGINQANRKLLVVNLTTKDLTDIVDLTYRADDLCIHRPSNRLFLVNENTSYISEIDLDTYTESNTITWAANHWSDGTTPTPFEIECGADKLYVVDGQWAPVLWTIDLAPPNTPVEQTTVSNIGGLALSADEAVMYTWYQYGWSAGSLNSHVKRYDKEPVGYSFVEQSATSYPQHDRGPLDAPIFYHEASERIINKQYVFNSLNLGQVINRFNDTDVIYAEDFSRERVASKRNILSLTDFQTLRSVPIVDPDSLFFDTNGSFYMIKNAKSTIYYLPESDI